MGTGKCTFNPPIKIGRRSPATGVFICLKDAVWAGEGPMGLLEGSIHNPFELQTAILSSVSRRRYCLLQKPKGAFGVSKYSFIALKGGRCVFEVQEEYISRVKCTSQDMFSIFVIWK